MYICRCVFINAYGVRVGTDAITKLLDSMLVRGWVLRIYVLIYIHVAVKLDAALSAWLFTLLNCNSLIKLPLLTFAEVFCTKLPSYELAVIMGTLFVFAFRKHFTHYLQFVLL